LNLFLIYQKAFFYRQIKLLNMKKFA